MNRSTPIFRVLAPIALLLGLTGLVLESVGSEPHPQAEATLPKTTVFPFFEAVQREQSSRTSIAPLYSSFSEAPLDHHEWDVLYPLISYDRYGEESRLHVLQLLSFSGGTTQTNSAKRTTLFPFYFRQESDDPEKAYAALLPFYGTIKNRLFRDEIKVVLFPAYLQSRKKDVVTDNYLVPFVHIRRGDELRGWQVWPLAGWETKGMTQKTNVLGTVTPVGAHRKLSVAWPFYFRHQTDIGTTNPQTEHALLPLFSSLKSPERDSLTAPWPVGLTITHDRKKQYREYGAPWPFIVFARGPGKTTNRIWPFFGNAKNPDLESTFYLWPLYRYRQFETDYESREKTRWLFFLYTLTRTQSVNQQAATTHRALWPLYTHTRRSDGSEKLQVGVPLEALLPSNETIERQYSPFWALWRSQKDPAQNTHSASLLWNLYRRDVTKEQVNGSALFGLVRWQRSPSQRTVKLLGMKIFGNKQNRRANP